MSELVDARGLSCPQPVILTRRKMKELKRGIFEVLVDSNTSKENVSRMAHRDKWEVEVEETKDGYHLMLKKD
jgi:TusA-related sulfurtransferase